MEYKKSYLGFWLWILGFCSAYFLCAFLPNMRTQLLVAILDNIMTISTFILTLIIFLSENIYWYNGTEYEEALAAGSERRKTFALAHMKCFGGFAAGFFVYSLLSILLGIPYGVDIAVVTIGLVITAIRTIKIKL